MKKNFIWIIIDGCRPDKLRSCGNADRPKIFIDEILEKGILFTKVITPGANTKTSMHSSFTSLYPSINKMNAYDLSLQGKLHPTAASITDVLHFHGYKNFRYVDVSEIIGNFDKHQVVPSSGFDIWESSGYPNLQSTPKKSFDTPKRNSLINEFNDYTGPKFLYVHLCISHDLASWNSEVYCNNIKLVSEDFRSFWEKLIFNSSDLILVSTDHGARLDIGDVHDEENKYGVRLRDMSMNTFACFIKDDFKPIKIDKLCSTLDLVPTVLDILECNQPPLLSQGENLLPLMKGTRKNTDKHVFMETGGIFQDHPVRTGSDVWGVRTEEWKYWHHNKKGDWLINLKNDIEETHNLIGTNTEIQKSLSKKLDEYIHDKRMPLQVYSDNAKNSGTKEYFTKSLIKPDICVLFIITDRTKHIYKTIKSIKTQLCVYFELQIADLTNNSHLQNEIISYGDYRIKYLNFNSITSIYKWLQNIKHKFFTVVMAAHYEPVYLYTLAKEMKSKSGNDVVYSDYKLLDQSRYEAYVATKNIMNNQNIPNAAFLAKSQILSKGSSFQISLNSSNTVICFDTTSLNTVYLPVSLAKLFRNVNTFEFLINYTKRQSKRAIKALRHYGPAGFAKLFLERALNKVKNIW